MSHVEGTVPGQGASLSGCWQGMSPVIYNSRGVRLWDFLRSPTPMGAAALLLAPSCLECESWSRLPGVPLGTWHLRAHAGLGMETLKLDLALAG